jgi:hypothetical protein
MNVSDLAQVLLTEIEDSGSTEFVERIKCQAKEAILNGKGTIGGLTSSGVNGKTFQRTITMHPAQVLDACQQALAEYNGTGGAIGATYADFRSITR